MCMISNTMLPYFLAKFRVFSIIVRKLIMKSIWNKNASKNSGYTEATKYTQMFFAMFLGHTILISKFEIT